MLDEGEAAAVAHDEVVEYPDVDQGQGIPKPQGDELVRLTGLQNAGGVVMGEDQRRGVVEHGLSHHLPWVHAGAVEGAPEQLLEGDQAVPVIEIQDAQTICWLSI